LKRATFEFLHNQRINKVIGEHALLSREQTVSQIRFATAMRTKDEGPWTDGYPLRVGKCLEIAEVESGVHMTYRYSE